MGQNNVDWLTISPLSGSGKGVITVSASTYSGLTERVAQITATNNTYSLSATSEISQVMTYEGKYLTFEIISGGSIHAGIGSGSTVAQIYHSINNAEWIEHKRQGVNASGISFDINVNEGDVVRVKGNDPGWSFTSGDEIKCNVYGNIMSIIYGDNFVGQYAIPNNKVFNRTFAYFYGLISAGDLILPATALTSDCYEEMFSYCTGLTSAPQLPSTALASGCYEEMFENCTSLTTAPALQATTLENWCYKKMFAGCTSLTTPPQVIGSSNVGTHNTQSCFGMFSGCTSLTTAPTLPATTVGSGACSYMFSNCTSLTTAPTLPATTLYASCYEGMFNGCTSLTTAPELPATTLADACYSHMFSYCTSLTEAPELPASRILDYAYCNMFQGCSSLSLVKLRAKNYDSNTYGFPFQDWLDGVATGGTIYKYILRPYDLGTGGSGVPSGWARILWDD